MKYQLLKNGIPVAIAYNAADADRLYMEYECDECIGISEERTFNDEPRKNQEDIS